MSPPSLVMCGCTDTPGAADKYPDRLTKHIAASRPLLSARKYPPMPHVRSRIRGLLQDENGALVYAAMFERLESVVGHSAFCDWGNVDPC
jgi:hypothetical protein